MGGFLKSNNQLKLFAYGLDLENNTFYSIKKRSVKAKNPKRITEDVQLPLEDIAFNMEILILTTQLD